MSLKTILGSRVRYCPLTITLHLCNPIKWDAWITSQLHENFKDLSNMFKVKSFLLLEHIIQPCISLKIKPSANNITPEKPSHHLNNKANLPSLFILKNSKVHNPFSISTIHPKMFFVKYVIFLSLMLTQPNKKPKSVMTARWNTITNAPSKNILGINRCLGRNKIELTHQTYDENIYSNEKQF